VRSLLPARGANLTYEWDAAGCLHSVLGLTAPAVVIGKNGKDR